MPEAVTAWPVEDVQAGDRWRYSTHPPHNGRVRCESPDRLNIDHARSCLLVVSGARDDLYTADRAAGEKRLNDVTAAAVETNAQIARRIDAYTGEPIRIGWVFDPWGIGGAEWGAYQSLRWMEPRIAETRMVVGQRDNALSAALATRSVGRVELVHPDGDGGAEWYRRQTEDCDACLYTPFRSPQAVDIHERVPVVAANKVNLWMPTRKLEFEDRCRLVWSLSDAARTSCDAAFQNAARITVPFGVPHVPFTSDEGTTPELCWVGRLSAPEKNRRLLMRCIRETVGHVRWRVAGYFNATFRLREPKAVAEWEEFVREFRVHWYPDLAPWQVAETLASCWAGVSTATTEGQQLSAVELMARGVPIIGMDCGGLRDVIVSGATGYLTPPMDEEALLGAVDSFLGLRHAARQWMRDGAAQLARTRFDAYSRANEIALALLDQVGDAKASRSAPSREVAADKATGKVTATIPAPPAMARSRRKPRVAFCMAEPILGGLEKRLVVLCHHLSEAGRIRGQMRYDVPAVPDVLPWHETNGVPYTVGEPMYRGADVYHLGSVRYEDAIPERSVVSLVGVTGGKWLGRCKQQADRIAAVILVDGSLMPYVPEVLRDRAVVIPSGIDADYWWTGNAHRARTRRRLGLTRETWVWAARMHDPRKRLDLLMQVARELPDRDFLVVGSYAAGFEPAAEKFREALRGAGNVRWVSDAMPYHMPALYAAADGIVQTSDTEGLPQVLMEAAAAGCSVVCTDVGGSASIARAVGGQAVPRNQLGPLVDAIRRADRMKPGYRAAKREEIRNAFPWLEYLVAHAQVYARAAEV